MDLQKLPGVGAVMEKKLVGAGIENVYQLLSHPPAWVAEKTGMDLSAAETLFRKAKKKINIPVFTDAKSLQKKRSEMYVLSTGSADFDKFMKGGFESESTTEIYGKNGTAKTQICHSMAYQCVKQTGGKVVWIDTEGTFRPERIELIASTLGDEPGPILDNIMVAEALNSSDQKEILEAAEAQIMSENIKLLIIDSAIGLFRSEYTGMGTLANRQQQLNKFLTFASHISKVYSMPVILTNQMQTSPGVMYGNPDRPTGGNIMGHESTYRIYVRTSGEFIVLKMEKSVQAPKHEVILGITDAGIVDKAVKEELIKEAKKRAD